METRAASWRGAGLRIAAAGVVAMATAAPVMVWNLRHDAAGARHLLGYVSVAGGDRPAIGVARLSLASMLEYPLVQFAVIGPVIVLAIAGARSRVKSDEFVERRRFVRFAWCMAAPMLLVFFAASLRTPIQANWPIAAFLSLMPLAAIAVVDGHQRGWWSATLAYGLAALIVIHFPLVAARTPLVGRFVPVHRFHGLRARALDFDTSIRGFLARTSGRGLVIAVSHNEAGLFAYYLPTHPVIASAGRFLGNRPSAYDFFADTALDNPALAGRPALFIGGTLAQWNAAFRCRDLQMIDADGPQFVSMSFAP
jgi:hypothetical protein